MTYNNWPLAAQYRSSDYMNYALAMTSRCTPRRARDKN